MTSQSIPVKMGSNRLQIDLLDMTSSSSSSSKMTCAQFVDMVLKRCKLNVNERVAKTYAVFESVRGMETLLRASDDIAVIWSKWQKQDEAVEFVIRKCRPIEKKCAQLENGDMVKKKCYKKMKDLNNNNNNNINQEEAYMRKIYENELKLRKQSKQLLKMEKSIQKHLQIIKSQSSSVTTITTTTTTKAIKKTSSFEQNTKDTKFNENINFLKLLYLKLKASTSASFHHDKDMIYSSLIEQEEYYDKDYSFHFHNNHHRSTGGSSNSSSSIESLV